jgi:hypothetical protein
MGKRHGRRVWFDLFLDDRKFLGYSIYSTFHIRIFWVAGLYGRDLKGMGCRWRMCADVKVMDLMDVS